MRIDIVKRFGAFAVSVIFVVSALNSVPLASSGDTESAIFTLTTQADFNDAERKWNVDTTSDPGNVSLTPSPTDWIKLSEELSLVARMPSPRFYAPAVWDGNFAYIFGGEDGVPVNLDQIVRYDPTTRTVTVMDSALPSAGGQMSVVWDGSVAYLFGGTTQGGGSPRDEILKYDPSTDTLAIMTEVLPSSRYSTAAVWTGSGALIFGGTDNSVVFDDILNYDPLLDKVSHLSAKLPGTRLDASAGWDGSNAFIFGGQRGSLFLDEIVKYEPATDSVTLMSARLPWGLAQTSAVFDGRFFYIFGGQTSTGSIDHILRYDPSSDSIRVLDATFPTQRCATSAVWTGSKALIFGGWPFPMDDVIEHGPGTNPVLTVGQPGSWDDHAVGSPSVLKDGSLYKMWYMGVSSSSRWHWKIGYAESLDGLSWTKRATPVFMADPASSWEHYGVDRPVVLKIGNTYKMWYGGYTDESGRTNRIGYAESSNGIDWIRGSSAPVLELGNPNEWDSEATWKVFVMFENGGYRMWYTGHDGINCHSSIGYAESADGITWTRFSANPILGPQAASWEGRGIEVSHVEKIGGQYIMWYNRHCPPEAIGVAVSPDGLNWTKHPLNPVLEKGDPSSWDNKGVTWVTVLREPNAIKMWYSGDHTSKNWGLRIGYATAAYGSRFVEKKSNPVLDLGAWGGWESRYVYMPTVVKGSAQYEMWYTGYGGTMSQIGYSMSENGMSWSRQGSVPVLYPGSPGSWDERGVGAPSVIYDETSGQYWMWYAGFDITPDPKARIGLATSYDGINWMKYDDPSTTLAPYHESDPVLNLGSPGEWDDYRVGDPHVIYDEDEGLFKMWFSGVRPWVSRIGYAYSTDGINWTKSPSNPIMSPAGGWESLNLGEPTVTKQDGVYRMWYMGTTGTFPRIGLAESTDGISWSRHSGNPVLIGGGTGAWDWGGVGGPTVLLENDTLRMWFHGGGEGTPIRIGHAVSSDGIHWTKRAVNPVLDVGFPNSWDQTDITGSHVLKTNGEYMMWYRGGSGSNLQIGLAQSTDGLNWEKDSGNPVMARNAGQWDEYVGSPCVLYSDGFFEMWYMGISGSLNKWKIGYANSTDGIHWNRYSGNPILDVGPPGSWDSFEVLHPYVIMDTTSGIYKMWFSGDDDNTHYKIGYAESADGLNWIKDASNPVLVGEHGTWEERVVGQPSVVRENGIHKMWYFGQDTSNRERIGFAVSFDGKTWIKSLLNPVLKSGPTEAWDSRKVAQPSVMISDREYVMWFSGRDVGWPYDWKIGTAVSDYTSTGTLVSQVFDSNGTTWKNVSWDALIPANTALGVSVRTGNTPEPDESWTGWGEDVYDRMSFDINAQHDRYLQYRATFVSMDGRYTPVLSEVGIGYSLNVSFHFRIAGEKWHNVEIYLFEEGQEIGYAEITRYPGSPNGQMVKLADVSIDFTKTYSAMAYYTPEDDPENGQKWGANPAWLIMEFESGQASAHHTFNVRHKKTWTWEIENLNQYLPQPNVV